MPASPPGLLIRWRGTTPARRQVRPGVFALVNGLHKAGRLTPEEAAFRAHHNAWFDRHLALPTDVDPKVYDPDLNPGAVAWFRATALTCLERVPGYLAILDAHGIPWERVEAHHAGRVVYEDDLQVVAVPVP
ncbi:MAG: hypothetical protein ACXVXT_17165 [Blastococcus sp.]